MRGCVGLLLVAVGCPSLSDLANLDYAHLGGRAVSKQHLGLRAKGHSEGWIPAIIPKRRDEKNSAMCYEVCIKPLGTVGRRSAYDFQGCWKIDEL